MRKESSIIYSRYYTYIKPITQIPIVRNYASTIFALVTVTVFIFFAIKPTVETIIVLQKKLADSSQVLDQVTKKVENLSSAKQNYDRLDSNIKNRIQSQIPDNIALRSLIQSLEQTAADNQASISALQIQPVTLEGKQSSTATNLSEVGFMFNVEGNYQNLISLLQEIQRSARLISIDNIVFNRTEENQGLVMSLTGKSYYIK